MPFYLSPVFRRRDSRMLLHILAGIGYGRKTSRHKICLALQDLAVLLNENPLSSPGKLSLPCLSHPWFACFHFFARRKYELTTKSKRFSMIFIFIALSRPVSDKFAFHLPRYSCKSVPGASSPPSTWHGIPAKAFQVAFPAIHLARNSRESVPGVLSCLPPGTEFPRKCSRCPFLPPTWHGIPAKAFQVSLLRRPPATVSLQKRSRCHFLPPTWHGIPAKAWQVSFPASHLARFSSESVPGGISLPSTRHGFPAKAFQVSLPASHLARNPRESVPGSFSCRPPGTASLLIFWRQAVT